MVTVMVPVDQAYDMVKVEVIVLIVTGRITRVRVMCLRALWSNTIIYHVPQKQPW